MTSQLAFALQARENGIRRSARKAGDEWLCDAYTFPLGFAKSHRVFTGEEVSDAARHEVLGVSVSQGGARGRNRVSRQQRPELAAGEPLHAVSVKGVSVTRSDLRPYVGRYVEIRWRDPCHDWPYYRLLAVGKEQAFLRGEDSPDGECIHDGDEFCAPIKDVLSIKVVVRAVA